MAANPPGRVVFIGDIPFELNTDQVLEFVKTVGPVVNFRLPFDKERQRSRGYGFVEYATPEDAARAVNTFNGLKIQNRTLRADFSHEMSSGNLFSSKSGSKPTNNNYNNGNGNRNRNDHNGSQNHSSAYNQSSGYDRNQRQQQQQPRNDPNIPRNLVVNDNISRNLSQIPPKQLVEIVQSLKTLLPKDAAQAQEILRSNHNLTYAIVQSLLLMGLVDTSVVAQAIPGQPQQPQQQHQQQQPQQQQYQHPPASLPPPPPPPNQTWGMHSQPPQNIDPQKAALISQVLQLTDSQIMTLPPDQQATMLMLRDNYRRGIFT